jgi:hypothetical protein
MKPEIQLPSRDFSTLDPNIFSPALRSQHPKSMLPHSEELHCSMNLNRFLDMMHMIASSVENIMKGGDGFGVQLAIIVSSC